MRTVFGSRCQQCWLRWNYSSTKQLSYSKKFSTAASPSVVDVSTLVTGLSNEQVKENPAIASYLAANFPNYGKSDESSSLSDEIVSEGMEGGFSTGGAAAAVAGKNEEVAVAANNNNNINNIREMFSFQRDPKREDGSRACQRLREDFLIPGLIYGADPIKGIDSSSNHKLYVKTPWNQLQRELDRYHHNFESRVYDMTVYENPDDTESGTVHRVMPRDLQFHPILNKLYCVNYLRYFPGRIIKIPIVYINEEESAAMKRDGFIASVNRFIPCVVEDGVPIPEHLELECTGLRLKEVVRIDRIIFPDGVQPIKKINDQFLIGTVFGKGEGAGPSDNAAAPTDA
eukprot:CAMPEP_0197824458 /NCGR_PEP_ID=MMETSP1437-20131217/1694_1 /TAXON_ID=49252 ORGANISM="Eucampia antarctica, Strain CCMP1452" /NCGR_SAMPLE_ID=MMETSP1437 /ASSEMBLY_ACC=CAM_ASM_001096 /LENGTH=342 /DNA_ID=CAMNT_0043424083 /DNA_START=8 /DNA_END=1039 /DNA_ORIENTATION=-